MGERVRLTSRTAEDLKAKAGKPVQSEGTGVNNDVYQMNNDAKEKNDPKIDQYAKGSPEEWAEGVAPQNWASQDKGGEKRDPKSNVPDLIDKHAASEAIASVKRLEEKAMKCIVAAQRILPGAPEKTVEAQATELMHYPDFALNAMLSRQEELAKSIAKAASETAKSAKDKGKGKDKEDDDKGDGEDEHEDSETKEEEDKEEGKDKKKGKKGKKGKMPAGFLAMIKAKKDKAAKDASDAAAEIATLEAACKEEEEEEEEAAKEPVKEEEEEEEEEEAKKEPAKEEEEEEEEAKKEPAKEEEEEEEEAKKKPADEKEEEEEASKEASDNLLTDIFSAVTASTTKKGASKLSGMVKKEASQGDDRLSQIWGQLPPDVSSYFA